jgi:hypothetical protein
MTSYVLWSDTNNIMETFAGPCRLAKWAELPEGWGIEEFQGTVSKGIISLAEVKARAKIVEEMA